MSKPQQKTLATAAPVEGYIAAIEDEGRRADCRALVELMREASGCEPVMWGAAIVGFDRYHYTYESGHSGEAALVAFSNRKSDLTLYLVLEGQEALLARLGKHKTGKVCLYLKRLADVDMAVLRELVQDSVRTMRKKYPDRS